MPKIKSARDIAAKWARVAPGRQQDFEAGVKDPSAAWAAPAAAARESYEAGVTEAIGRGAYVNGINDAGDGKWRRKTVEIGAQRWGPGVRAAQPDMEAGFAPYRDVIEATELPPRAPRGDPRNIERVSRMAQALAERRRRGS